MQIIPTLNVKCSFQQNQEKCPAQSCIKYARMRVFTDSYSQVSTILSLYGRIRVSENPCSHIFYVVHHTFSVERTVKKWDYFRLIGLIF